VLAGVDAFIIISHQGMLVCLSAFTATWVLPVGSLDALRQILRDNLFQILRPPRFWGFDFYPPLALPHREAERSVSRAFLLKFFFVPSLKQRIPINLFYSNSFVKEPFLQNNDSRKKKDMYQLLFKKKA
jgi:hypothetical protein